LLSGSGLYIFFADDDCMRTPLIAGNWKMNGTAVEARLLATALAGGYRQPPLAASLVVCPPFVHLALVQDILKETPLRTGGQDCSAKNSGAFTGEVSAPMLRDIGASYVILGHSERRQYHGETDALIQQKASAAQAAGLTPIVCVGETLAEREAGRVEAVLTAQTIGSIPPGSTAATLVLAYEPVWAIGTGVVATAAQVAEAHAHLRTVLTRLSPALTQTRVLYGGSVKPDNAEELLGLEDVDGALVGGASLQAETFWAIARKAP
jgi:triosephosphate isomerase (TIM)